MMLLNSPHLEPKLPQRLLTDFLISNSNNYNTQEIVEVDQATMMKAWNKLLLIDKNEKMNLKNILGEELIKIAHGKDEG